MIIILSSLDIVNYGIINGNMISDVEEIGSCSGKEFSTFKCKGENKFIKWNVDLESSDFRLESEFKVDKVAATMFSFVLWSGTTQFKFNLDGTRKKLLYMVDADGSKGGALGKQVLGKSNLDPNKFQTIVVTRTGNSLKISLDEKQWRAVDITAPIDAIGWRPWRNTIYIKSLKFSYGNSEICYNAY